MGVRERRYVEAYAQALASYRAGCFAEAERLWRAVEHPTRSAGSAPPPQVMAQRAAHLKEAAPEAWDGVWVRTTK